MSLGGAHCHTHRRKRKVPGQCHAYLNSLPKQQTSPTMSDGCRGGQGSLPINVSGTGAALPLGTHLARSGWRAACAAGSARWAPAPAGSDSARTASAASGQTTRTAPAASGQTTRTVSAPTTPTAASRPTTTPTTCGPEPSVVRGRQTEGMTEG